MNEESRKKREWVKSAAIVFLSIMLVLTFFSNTIMNYSLPEVATQMIMSGTITSKIRGTGIVESGDPYNVEVTESRKVASVAVRVGDTVAKGDVLFELVDKESDELKAAQDTLETLQKDYDATILAGLDAGLIQKVENGNVPTTEEYLKRISNLQKAIETAEKEVQAAQEDVNEWTSWIAALDLQLELNASTPVVAAVEYNALVAAKNEQAAAVTRLEQAQAAYDAALDLSGNDPQNMVKAEQDLAVANADKTAADEKVAKCQTAYDAALVKAQEAREQMNKSLQVQRSDATVQLRNTEKVREEKQAVADQKNMEYNELISSIPTEMNLVEKLNAIAEQKELIAELEASSIGTTITADIAGTISSLNVIAGQTTNPGSPVAVIQPAGAGYTLSFTVTNEQAQRVSVGDVGELVNSWWYSDIQAVVSSIRPDMNNPTKNKLLNFELTGDVTAGQSLTLSVGSRSATYDMIVPNSAIREDNNGKFILIVEQKSSPLGNRYKATRVDVEVVASDETQSAITGGLYGYESVITTATKPVEAGQLVRLPD